MDWFGTGDGGDIAELYNSNTDFLQVHMHTDHVTSQWVTDELESMKRLGFSSVKALEKGTNKVAGIIEFELDAESYLSLMMVHRDCANRGYGTQIYQAFEAYAHANHSTSVRLDVVTGYSDAVLNFWTRNGFEKDEDISLNWNGVVLPAVTMKKDI